MNEKYYMSSVLPSAVTVAMCAVHPQPNLYLPEVCQSVWPKHVAASYNKRKHCAPSW